MGLEFLQDCLELQDLHTLDLGQTRIRTITTIYGHVQRMVREEHCYAVFENINMSRNKVTVLSFKILDLVFSMFVHV